MASTTTLLPEVKLFQDRRERCYVIGAILLVLALYAWALNASVITIFGDKPQGYYGLLTDAITSGQLHLKIEPHPGLQKLANPWAGAQDVPRLHDASYYNGHYYLYFGVTPVLVLLAPWRLLTGTFLSDGTGTVVFAVFGFLLGTRLWLLMRRDWFRELKSTWVASGVLMIGIGNYVYFLLQAPVFYHVPITCAYFCLMAAMNAIYNGLRHRGSGKAILWFGIASLLWALSVGARPNYIFSLPIVLVLALVRGRGCAGNPKFTTSDQLRLLFWAVVPAFFVGAGLAWYNFMRFGDVREFGVSYQFAAVDQRFLNLTNPANIPVTLKEYAFAGANYSPYFPFVQQRSDVIGIVPWAPFVLAALFFPFALLLRRTRDERIWTAITSSFLLVAVLHLLSLCLLPFANDRYVADFVPSGILVSLALCGLLGVRLEHGRRVLRICGVLLCTLALITFTQSTLLSLQRHSSKSAVRTMGEIGNLPAYLVEKLLGISHGPIVLDVVFDANSQGTNQPLVVAGSGRDRVMVQYEADSNIRFSFFHEGTGGPRSDPIHIEPGRRYTVSVDLGALYPPPDHPAFRGWSGSMVDALRRRVEIRLDGRPVLHWTSDFYPSDPWHVIIGKNPRAGSEAKTFGGKILAVRHAGMPSKNDVLALPGNGPVRLNVRFPAFVAVTAEPILSTGRPGSGDLIYVKYLSPTRLRFGHDSWGAGAVDTTEVEYDPARLHTVEIDIGSLDANATDLAQATHRFQLRFDGKLLISTFRPFHPSQPLDICLGYNATLSSAASPLFTGAQLSGERMGEFPAPPALNTGSGPVRMAVLLPPAIKGVNEPLLVSGSPGAGDFIYISSPDERHIQVALDHWGGQSATGEIIEVDRARPVTFVISTDALYPLDGDQKEADGRKSWLRGRVIVAVDNHIALNAAQATYPAGPSSIAVGENPIGGSSCTSRFSGVIQLVERIAPAELKTLVDGNSTASD